MFTRLFHFELVFVIVAVDISSFLLEGFTLRSKGLLFGKYMRLFTMFGDFIWLFPCQGHRGCFFYFYGYAGLFEELIPIL